LLPRWPGCGGNGRALDRLPCTGLPRGSWVVPAQLLPQRRVESRFQGSGVGGNAKPGRGVYGTPPSGPMVACSDRRGLRACLRQRRGSAGLLNGGLTARYDRVMCSQTFGPSPGRPDRVWRRRAGRRAAISARNPRPYLVGQLSETGRAAVMELPVTPRLSVVV